MLEDRPIVVDEALIAKHTAPQVIPRGVITYMQNVPYLSSEMRAMSVVTVNTLSMLPTDAGLQSNKLGTVDETACGTCKRGGRDCSMHWGIIELPRAMIRPEAKAKVAILLNSFCVTCAPDDVGVPLQLHYSDQELSKFINVTSDDRLSVIFKNANTICNGTCETYVAKEDSVDIIRESKGKKTTSVMDVTVVLSLLNRMREEDLIKLGINVYPASRYVMDAIPVPPNAIRPVDPQSGKSHPLTIALKQILMEIIEPGGRSKRSNKNRKNGQEEPGESAKGPRTPNMQDIAKAYINYITEKNETKIKNTTDKYIGLKGIMDGKKGHIREVINGKRTNHCIRSVASPDANLKITEIGIPEEVANSVTTEETIFNLNRELYQNVLVGQSQATSTIYIQDLVTRYRDYERRTTEVNRSGAPKDDHKKRIKALKAEFRQTILEYNLFYESRGQIKRITRLNREGTKLTIILDSQEKATKIRLRNGDIIHRTLVNGDIVIFNRQPGLHKYSVVAAKVRIRPYRSIGLHPSHAPGANGDFDGDEFNINVPQTYMAKADALAIMQFDECTVSEKNGTIVNGIIQDAILGLYLMTQDSVVLSPDQWQQCISATGIPQDAVVSLLARGTQLGISYLYSGKMLASVLLPAGFNYSKAVGTGDGGRRIEIQDGILTRGTLDKAIVFGDQNSILQNLHKSFGAPAALFFQENSYPLVQEYFEATGFSVGYSDCRMAHDLDAKVKALIETASKEIAINQGTIGDQKYESITSAKINNMKAKVDKMILDNTDRQVMTINRNGTTQVVGIYCTYTGTGKLVLPKAEVSSIVLNYNAKYAYWLDLNEKRNEIQIANLISVTSQYQSISSAGGIDSHMDTRWWFRQNPFLSHTESGSKGNFNNFIQAVGMVGQQYLGSERIPAQLANNKIMLPHFRVGDNDPITRGFGDLPYSAGVQQRQHYASAIAARKAATATITATPVTGYSNRKLTKLLENNVTQFDLTVRSTPYAYTNTRGQRVIAGTEVITSSGNATLVGGPIVQFIYGDMGLAINKLIKINGVFTFTNLGQNVHDITARAARQKPFAYVMFLGEEDDYVAGLVSLLSLTRLLDDEDRQTIDILVIFKPSVPLSIQYVIKALSDKAVKVNWTSPVWAYQLEEYTKVMIISPYLLQARSNSYLFNETHNGTVVVQTEAGNVPALALIRPQPLPHIHLATLENDPVFNWLEKVLIANESNGTALFALPEFHATSSMRNLSRSEEREVVGILFDPSIYSINEATNRNTQLWNDVLFRLMDKFPTLHRIKQFTDAT